MLLLLTVLSFLSLGFVVTQNCYQDWHYYEGFCYGFGEDVLSWAEAQEMCEAFDGKLLEIKTSEESDWVKHISGSRTEPSYWLGGTDIFHEGTWVWSSDRQEFYPFSDWAQGEPTNSADHEDCLVMGRKYNFTWNDIPCETETNFICKTMSLETVVG